MTLEDFKSNPRTMYTAQEYERLVGAKEEAESMLSDDEMKDLAQGEIDALVAQKLKKKLQKQ
jgi:hypothetical protein